MPTTGLGPNAMSFFMMATTHAVCIEKSWRAKGALTCVLSWRARDIEKEPIDYDILGILGR